MTGQKALLAFCLLPDSCLLKTELDLVLAIRFDILR